MGQTAILIVYSVVLGMAVGFPLGAAIGRTFMSSAIHGPNISRGKSKSALRKIGSTRTAHHRRPQILQAKPTLTIPESTPTWRRAAAT
jgi:hypothetical protein